MNAERKIKARTIVAMKQMTKDKDGAKSEFDSEIDDYRYDLQAAHHHFAADFKYSSRSQVTTKEFQVPTNEFKARPHPLAEGEDSLLLRGWRYREPVLVTDRVFDMLHSGRHHPRRSGGSSEYKGRTFLDLARADASLGRKSDGPVPRPSRKMYGTTVLRSKILQHSGLLGDVSIPTTISKDTSKGIEARNRSLLENFGTKKTQLGPPRNSPFILDACPRGTLSRRPVIMLDRPIREFVPTWRIDDLAERQRIQNLIVHRNYRKKLNRRLKSLESQTDLSDDGKPKKQHQWDTNAAVSDDDTSHFD